MTTRRLPTLFGLVLLGIMISLGGCTSTGSGKLSFRMPRVDAENLQNLVWPSSPETPRYAFIGHIYGESNAGDSGAGRSSVSRFLHALAGTDIREKGLDNLVQPQQITSDNAGRIYVADAGRQAVFLFDEAQGEMGIWDETSLDIPFLSPVGVAFGGNSVWVSDAELGLVYRFTPNGALIDTIGQGMLSRPTGISFDDEQQRLFVSDTGADNVKLFDASSGELIGIWSHSGSEDGTLNHPTFIHYRFGRLYVADSLNARIVIFDDQGNHVETLGHRGLYVGNFSRPKGVGVDSDNNIYVTESYYDYLLIYNSQGELLMSIGGSGAAPGKFSQPTGLWVDEHDRVFVSDMLNSRVSVFQYLGSD